MPRYEDDVLYLCFRVEYHLRMKIVDKRVCVCVCEKVGSWKTDKRKNNDTCG